MTSSVKKETYIDADEKTTKALTFDILSNIDEKLDSLKVCHEKHIEVCKKRFVKIEDDVKDGRKKDAKSSSIFGFLGGFVAMVLYYLKTLFD